MPCPLYLLTPHFSTSLPRRHSTTLLSYSNQCPVLVSVCCLGVGREIINHIYVVADWEDFVGDDQPVEGYEVDRYDRK